MLHNCDCYSKKDSLHIFALTVTTFIVVLKTDPMKIRQPMDFHNYY